MELLQRTLGRFCVSAQRDQNKEWLKVCDKTGKMPTIFWRLEVSLSLALGPLPNQLLAQTAITLLSSLASRRISNGPTYVVTMLRARFHQKDEGMMRGIRVLTKPDVACFDG